MTDKFAWVDPLLIQLTSMLPKPSNCDQVKTHKSDLATLAYLRRGLSDSTACTLTKVGWVFKQVPNWQIEQAIIFAGLFALAKGACPQTDGVNFGQAFARYGLTKATKDKKDGGTEKRIIALLDADAPELSKKLRHAVTLVINASIGLDWKQLAKDIVKWPSEWRSVQKAWARSYWSTLTLDEADESDQETADDETIDNTKPQTIS